MKRFILLLLLVLACGFGVSAQVSSHTAYNVRSAASAPPATCKAVNPTDLWFRSDTDVLYVCSATNTWTTLATAGSSGITNSAPANTVTKSDGTNLVASQLTDSGRALAGAAAVPATVNLTLAVQPTVGDTMTIGQRSYEFVANGSPLEDGEIALGANLAATQSVVAFMINTNVGYANADVSASAFSANVSILSARALGTSGNGIAVEGTFTSGSNLFSAAETSGGIDEVGYLAVGPSPAPQGPVRLGYQQPLTAADRNGNARKLIQIASSGGNEDGVLISTPAMPDDQEHLLSLKSSDGAETVFEIASDGDADYYLYEVNGAQFRWSSIDDAFVIHQLVSVDPDKFLVARRDVIGVAFQIQTDGTFATLGVNQLFLNATVTPAATVGAQTINKSAGSVNFAAAASSLVVTNSTVTASSIVICTVATNDSALKSVACVASANTITITANAAANAETRVNFWVITPQ